MKILATSDMHGMLDSLDFIGVDLVVFAGDIAPLKGHGPWHAYDQVKWMNKQFAAMCSAWPNAQFVFIPGNHDFFPIAKERFGHQLLGKDLRVQLPSNAHMLLDESITIPSSNSSNGLKIHGTPWVPIISHSWAFEAEHDILEEKFSKIPAGVDILITHTPPHISNDVLIDCSMQYGKSRPYGSVELAKAIFEKKPKYVFCGHIHSGDHSKAMLGETTVYNVSHVDERYEVAYEPLVLDI